MRYAIFDLDGTIVDSMIYWRSFEKEFLREMGIDEKEMKLSKNDWIGSDWVEALCDFFNKNYNFDFHLTPEKFHQWGIEFMMRKYANDVDFKPGAHQLLDTLKEQGVTGFYIGIILVFTGGSANDHDGRIGNFCRLPDHFIGKGHFHLCPRLFCPAAAYIEGIFLLPQAVGFCQLFVEL